MKKSVAITTIVALHAAIIGTLLVQAGCSSEPQKPQAGTAKVSAEEIADKTNVQEAPVNNDISDVTPPEGSMALRAAPTRPAWNMSGESSSINEVIVPYEDEQEFVKPASPAAPTTAKKAVAEPKANIAYTVKKGDTLSKIASQHGVSLGALMAANNLNRSSVIKIGQEIEIPGAPASAAVPKDTAPAVKSVSLAEDSATYIVKKGDSLSRIAKNTGMTVSQLMEVNGLKNHNIRIGQKLTVTKGGAAASSATPASARAVSTAGSAPAAGEISYTIKSGDTLGAIAKQHGTSISAISERNGISDPRKIRVGQVIVIKSAKAGAESATAKTEAPKASAPVAGTAQPTLQIDPVPAAPSTAEPVVELEEIEVINEEIPVVEL